MKLHIEKTFGVLLVLIVSVLSAYTSYACVSFEPHSIYYLESFNDTNPDVVYPVVYPQDYFVPAIPITCASNRPVKLVNNANAAEPTSGQLMNFVADYDTNTFAYNYSTFICTDAAERAHNKAETAGLKCGFVRIKFDGLLTIGHVINVFKMPHGGYVFADFTPSLNGKSSVHTLSLTSIDNANDGLTQWFSMFLDGDDNKVVDYHVYW